MTRSVRKLLNQRYMSFDPGYTWTSQKGSDHGADANAMQTMKEHQRKHRGNGNHGKIKTDFHTAKLLLLRNCNGFDNPFTWYRDDIRCHFHTDAKRQNHTTGNDKQDLQ